MNESALFHSKFGGLWYDSRNENFVAARLAQISDEHTRASLEFLRRWGLVILENAVSHLAIDKYLAINIWRPIVLPRPSPASF
jgi:hypothetical protein